ncbi:helicase C-terminal domain-containing protein [Sodalinema gerasimenkoae]|uniref:helicase C-terminal domain-containing protein n=1 Tax=Sodalinema gerasimenkoae TaxID=2862348 RepID=UPI001FE8E5A6|nr:helicase C-terminal domain-containing protein [Sodalinema gerasimenkoae]
MGQVIGEAVIEAEVHGALRDFLRVSGGDRWPHHLTMARLVARALRLGRDALIQTGVFPTSSQRYALSYLMPILMSPTAVVVIGSTQVRRQLQERDIPDLQAWLGSNKPVQEGDRLEAGFEGLLLTSPEAWLGDRLAGGEGFRDGVPTLIDGADDWERWTQQSLTVAISPQDWVDWIAASPDQGPQIRDVQVALVRRSLERPDNPYQSHIIDQREQTALAQLSPDAGMPLAWRSFWESWRSHPGGVWAKLNRRQGQLWLYHSPVDLGKCLAPLWERQPMVWVGGALDLERDAAAFRERLGLGDMTCVKFNPVRHPLHLYAPERLPLPNTPEYKPALLRELHDLIRIGSSAETAPGIITIIVGDVPLRAIVAAQLAADFGSRVRVQQSELPENGILISGWSFWREHQGELPASKLLVIATLPFPSLEDPHVSAQVAHYKQQRQDWFRLYLLPMALSDLQRAIAPIREVQGTVVLLDVRAIYRSYGQQIFAALSPYARVNSPDVSLFEG